MSRNAMSRSVDVAAVQMGRVYVVDVHRNVPDGEVVTLEIQGTIGGVHGNSLTVTADWWREHTPDPTPGLDD